MMEATSGGPARECPSPALLIITHYALAVALVVHNGESTVAR